MGTRELEGNRINAVSIIIKEGMDGILSKNFLVIPPIIISWGIKAF
jgi:hypothetical protein